METQKVSTIERTIREHCPACNKDTPHDMLECRIDVELQTADGIPMTATYACNDCGLAISKYEHLETFQIRAEIKGTIDN